MKWTCGPVAARSQRWTAPPASAPTGRHLLTGLLKQAGHLARGERLTLAQDAGLPDSLFLQARLAGRTLTRPIQL